jgi:hypothetical protein
LKHNSISDKDFLDSLVLDAKMIVKKAHAHARECESFRDVLKDEAGSPPSKPEPTVENTKANGTVGSDIQ